MKNFVLMLLIAGTHGFAGLRGIDLLDFDIGPAAQKKIDRSLMSRYVNPSEPGNALLYYIQRDKNEIKDDDQMRKLQNSIEEVRFCQGFVPYFMLAKADDEVHHQVHTHDVPYWNIQRNRSEDWPGKLCVLNCQQILTAAGTTGLCALPIFPEVTAP